MQVHWGKTLAAVAAVAALAIGGVSLVEQQRAISEQSRIAVEANARTAALRAAEAAEEEPTPSTVSSAPRKTALFIGDSYTGGAAGVPITETYASLVCEARNWVCSFDAIGGSGYVAGGQLNRNYQQRLDQTAATHPADFVFVTGGANDVNKPTISRADQEEATEQYIGRVRSAYPNAKLVVVSPFWMTTDPPDSLLEMRSFVKSAAEEVDAQWVNTDGWLNSSLISDDSVHPTPEGHEALKKRLLAATARLK